MILVRFEYIDNSRRSLEKSVPYEMVPQTNDYIVVEGNRVQVARTSKCYNQQKIFILIELVGGEQ